MINEQKIAIIQNFQKNLHPEYIHAVDAVILTCHHIWSVMVRLESLFWHHHQKLLYIHYQIRHEHLSGVLAHAKKKIKE